MVVGVLTWWILQITGWSMLAYGWFGGVEREGRLFLSGAAFFIFLTCIIIGRINDLERKLTDGK